MGCSETTSVRFGRQSRAELLGPRSVSALTALYRICMYVYFAVLFCFFFSFFFSVKFQGRILFCLRTRGKLSATRVRLSGDRRLASWEREWPNTQFPLRQELSSACPTRRYRPVAAALPAGNAGRIRPGSRFIFLLLLIFCVCFLVFRL